MLKLKLQYFGHLMRTADSLEKSQRLGKIKMRWLDGIADTMDMNLGKLREVVRDRELGMLQSMESQRVRHDWVTEQQQQ